MITYSHTTTCMQVSTAALFIRAKSYKQSKCLSISKHTIIQWNSIQQWKGTNHIHKISGIDAQRKKPDTKKEPVHTAWLHSHEVLEKVNLINSDKVTSEWKGVPEPFGMIYTWCGSGSWKMHLSKCINLYISNRCIWLYVNYQRGGGILPFIRMWWVRAGQRYQWNTIFFNKFQKLYF